MSFSSSPLSESFPTTRFSSPVPSPTHTETDLPIDVDQSFNSSMSISDASYLSPTPAMLKSKLLPGISNSHDSLLSPSEGMLLKPRRPDPVPIQARSERMFGAILSSNVPNGGGNAAAAAESSNKQGKA